MGGFTFNDILNKGLEVFDNIKLRNFKLDMAQAQARHESTMNAREVSQNMNVGGFDFSTKDLAYAGAGVAGAVILGFILVKSL